MVCTSSPAGLKPRRLGQNTLVNFQRAEPRFSGQFSTRGNKLAQILSRHTKMPVTVASDAMPIQANHVYVIPAGSDLKVENYFFKTIAPRSGRNKQIDVFFVSLAEAMAAHAIGVILSGYGGDGTIGCKHIKAKGGTTFAQDKSAEVGSMPMSAQDANCVDFVLPPEEMSYHLAEIAARFVQDNP